MSSEQLTWLSEEAPASPSLWPEVESLLKENPGSCLSTFALFVSYVLDGSCGRTSQGASVRRDSKARRVELSDSSSQSWANAGTAWHGVAWTRSLSEYPIGTEDSSGQSPRGAAVSFLSDALETHDVPLTYSLSAKACEGILRRAESRGKSLPDPLKSALERVADGE